jgi:transposase
MAKKRRDIKIKNIGGRDYAYDMISYWDKELKKYRKKSVYLGVVTDKEKKEYRPKAQRTAATISSVEKEVIQNFGDSYSIFQVVNHCRFLGALQVLDVNFDTLMSLVCFKILRSSAMQYAESWSLGNYCSHLYPEANLKSQRISDFLKGLGNERLWRSFFAEYIASITGEKTGIIIDSTGMPNEIDFPLSAWGNHGGECEMETRLMMVVDKASGKPLYFRYMAGNIVDVSTLKNTVYELSEMGVKSSFALLDAGFYSEGNIKDLYKNSIAFLTRLASNRKLHKELVENSADMENAANMVTYNKRALFVKKVEVDLFGNKGFAYVVCDVKRKGDECNKFLVAAKEDGLSADEIDKELNKKGKFVLISSEDMSIDEVIPLYYTRQAAENLFGISKSFLDLLPLRTHSIETFRGYLMLTFITLTIFLELKTLLKGKYTVEGAMTEMGNLMCKIYGKNVIVSEPTKKMKEIAEFLGYMVPMKLGV